jgi:hypothetical protein
MGALFSPPQPPPPPPPPEVPTLDSPEIDKASDELRKAELRRRGRRSTILTSGLGDLSKAPPLRPGLGNGISRRLGGN